MSFRGSQTSDCCDLPSGAGVFESVAVIRIAKIFLLFFAGLASGLVALGNVLDPQTNFVFVEHVLRMDTTFEGSVLRSRSVHSGAAHWAALGLIVVAEFIVSGLCLWGATRLVRAFPRDRAGFHAAKGPGLLGLLGALALWFFGFQVVGGEWFASWQSETWNGLDSAARFSTFALVSLLFLSLEND